MYIIVHEPSGKTILTDEIKNKFNESNLDNFDLELIDGSTTLNFPSVNGKIMVYTAPEPQELFKKYLSDKKTIHAAGGMVYNLDGLLLMIFRKGKWDMPKGKLDPGESIEKCALREVSEETGLNSISIDQNLMTTYHTYFIGKSLVIKPSHWYKMNFTGDELPIPQTEEDISEIRWVTKKQAKDLLNKMFPSIQEMIIRYYL